MLTNFYHCTPATKWKRIHSGEDSADGKPGLRLQRRFTDYSLQKYCNLPEQNFEFVSHGFLEAEPQAWYDHQITPDKNAFEAFMGGSGDGTEDWTLLKVTLRPDDEAYVIDYAPRAKYMMPSFSSTWAEAEKDHADVWNSRVHVADYTGRENMVLPQVICFTDIPINRVQLLSVTQKFKMVNRGRAKTGRPLVMPPRRPDDSFLDDLLKKHAPKTPAP